PCSQVECFPVLLPATLASPLSLHDALPISPVPAEPVPVPGAGPGQQPPPVLPVPARRAGAHEHDRLRPPLLVDRAGGEPAAGRRRRQPPVPDSPRLEPALVAAVRGEHPVAPPPRVQADLRLPV